MAIFDTHAHYDSSRFKKDRDAVLSGLPAQGVTLVVNQGCEVASSRFSVELAKKYPHVYAAVGIHPQDCGGCTDADFDAIRALAGEEKVVAIGEIGMDYHWEENPPKEFQEEVFRRQIELALELDLPIVVHDRDAHGDSLRIVLDYPELRGVFHCFAGSPEMAKELLKRGWYLGFDGPITYPNNRRAPEVVAVTPLDRIVVETDAPYLPPTPYRGKRNESRYLSYVIDQLAEWKGVSSQEMEDQTFQNGKRLFGLE